MKKNKVIELDCMLGGRNMNGDLDLSIGQKMKKILEENDNYDFVSLVYHQTRCINMEYASLIVKETVNK